MKLSFDKIRCLLCEALNPSGSPSELPSCWLEDIFEDEVVYNKAGKLYKAPYRIEEDKAVLGPPVEVEKETEYVPVFSVERLFSAFKETRDDGVVVRRGKLFEAGDFPDKNVTFDEEDLSVAASTFQPVENDLEHASTILDGHLGRLAKVWQKGKELYGEVELPAWLDKAIGNDPIKVSLAFDRSKKIVGNALVLRPRIADAAIMSAFSLSKPSPFSKGSEPEESKPMKLKDAIKHLFGLEKVEDLDVEVTLPEEVSAPASSPPDNPAPAQVTPPTEAPAFTVDPRLVALENQLLVERSFAFADEVIRSKKSLPAQREQIAAMFASAVRSDAGSGSVFSSETSALVEGAQVKAIRAFFASAPTHSFAGEAFVNDTAVLLYGAQAGNGGMSNDRKAKLLDASALGRKAVEVAKN